VRRIVTGAHGTQRPYDVLLLATGSNPIMLRVPGGRLPGVIAFRDLAGVNSMIEAAAGLRLRGMDVTVIHLAATLMERQLDTEAATLLERDLTARGVRIITGANIAAIECTERV
jgi:nitrite reductase (NADH) large subunit